MKQKMFIFLLVLLSIFIVNIAVITGIPFRDFYFFIYYFVFLYILTFCSFRTLYPIMVSVCMCHFVTVLHVEGAVFYRLLFWLVQYLILVYFVYFSSRYSSQKNINLELSFELSIMERIAREFLNITPVEDAMRLMLNVIRDLSDNVEGIFFNFIDNNGENNFIFDLEDGVVSEKKLRPCYNELMTLISEIIENDNYKQDDFLVISDFDREDSKYSNLAEIKNLIYFPIMVSGQKIGELITFSMHQELEFSEMELIGTFISRLSSTLESLNSICEDSAEV